MIILGRLLAGLVVAAVSAVAVAVTVKYIKGKIDKAKLANLARQEGIKEAIVQSIEKCENKVTLKDLNSDKTICCKGDGIAREIKVGIIV